MARTTTLTSLAGVETKQRLTSAWRAHFQGKDVFMCGWCLYALVTCQTDCRVLMQAQHVWLVCARFTDL